MTNTIKPARASLWTVDANGIGQGKPFTASTEEVMAAYRADVAAGASPTGLRITEAGKRPDGLGYRR